MSAFHDDVTQVFLSYSSEDHAPVARLYDRLHSSGLKPWMDKRDIAAGEDWERAIWRAIRRSDFVLICLSARSVTKRGFLQKEIKQALDLWQEKLEDDIYLIPVRLDNCNVPDNLRRFQWVDLQSEEGYDAILHAISEGVARRFGTHSTGSLDGSSNPIGKSSIVESVKLAISYNIDVAFPQFLNPHSQSQLEINGVIAGFACAAAMEFRRSALDQASDPVLTKHLTGATAFNDLGISYEITCFDSALLSVRFIVSEYGAGAMHPNYRFVSHNFKLDPPIALGLADLFVSDSKYLDRISELCIRDLIEQKRSERSIATDIESSMNGIDDWIRDGAAADIAKIGRFNIYSDCLAFNFDPYQVGSYAWGSRVVKIPFTALTDVLAADGPLRLLLKNGGGHGA